MIVKLLTVGIDGKLLGSFVKNKIKFFIIENSFGIVFGERRGKGDNNHDYNEWRYFIISSTVLKDLNSDGFSE